MLLKLKLHLKWIISLAAVIVLLVLFLAGQNPKVISATVNPEVIVNGQNQEVIVTVKARANLFSASKIKVTIVEQRNKKNKKTEAEWIKFFSVFQRNPKILGQLTKQGKDKEGELIYQGIFTVNNSTAETVQIQPVNIFGIDLLPQAVPQFARLAVTTHPAVIPPDLGEAGKATLEGIDSDHDGLRDDVQREIMFLAPQSAKTRAALTQYAKLLQQESSVPNLSHDDSNKLVGQLFNSLDCMARFVGGYGSVKTFGDYLSSFVLNTKLRKQTEYENGVSAGTYVYGEKQGDIHTFCTFSPDNLPD